MGKFTPFSQAYPDYVHQWHPDNALSPDKVARSSNKKVIWLCDKDSDHVWEASPNGRFKANGKVYGCPYCSGIYVSQGINDLASQFPHLALQWSVRNKLTPSEVHAFSNKTFWWEGVCGHEWDAPVIARSRQNNGCPYCSGHRVLKGFNDLSTSRKDLAKEWADDRDVLTVSAGSSYRARWKGMCGHEWVSSVVSRSAGEGCPYCSGRRVLKGFNDLASQHPVLAEMWHPSNSKRADEVSSGSGYLATWVCGEGHETKARVIEKVAASTKCPVCEGTVTVLGVTDFATKHPEIASQWVSGSKKPSEVRPMSSAKAIWRCADGHEWEAPFHRRSAGHGCPYCAGQRAVTGVNDLASRFPDLVSEWHEDNGIDPALVAASSSVVYKWVCGVGHIWSVSPNQRTSHKEGITGCPSCWVSGRSFAETELADFIDNGYHGKVVRRHKIGRMELDVYLPDIRVAFEFNGVYWHSEKCGRGKWSHYQKMKTCQDNRISLIQVWEDDWRDRRSVVEKMILRRIGADTSVKVGARTTKVVSVKAGDARKFLENNHIQGFVGGTNYDALVSSSGELVALMVSVHTLKDVRIARYATSTGVPGGFTKLLKVVSERARKGGYREIVTFSDNEISSGNLYSQNGFSFSGNLDPDYTYLHNASRVHKFMFRKSRFMKDPALKYDPSMSETELAQLNGITRIWDSGKKRWTLKI